MSAKVRIQPSGHEFCVQDGETLLEAALREHYVLPYGCRNGACGACKGKVVEGQVDLGKAATYTLTPDERSAGMVLFCCAKPVSDLVIECREVGAVRDIPVKNLPCRVESIERIAHNVAVLSLKLPASERLQFLAGQYIDIVLKDGKRRSFSLANAPHDDRFLQLHVRHIPGGTFSEYVFNEMKPKEILRFQGPLGTFFLREESSKPILFIASGTGFAPIKGIIEHAIHKGLNRPIRLYWGGRNRADLYLHELATRWAAELPQLDYIPVLSESPASDAWQGRTGLVHEAVLADISDFSGYQVYACGAPVMVEAAHRSFIERGLPEDEFFSDAFFLSKDLKPQG